MLQISGRWCLCRKFSLSLPQSFIDQHWNGRRGVCRSVTLVLSTIVGVQGRNINGEVLLNIFSISFKDYSPVIRQKSESQNGCFKETKYTKFSVKRTFLFSWYAHVRFALLLYYRRIVTMDIFRTNVVYKDLAVARYLSSGICTQLAS